jgi:archaellum component FlaC
VSHDEIRDYLDRIDKKLDSVVSEINGVQDQPGIKERLRDLEKESTLVKWVLGVIGTAAGASVWAWMTRR